MSDVTASREGPVGIIELSRPEKSNALDRGGFTAIRQAMEAFEAEGAGVRSVLLRAQGKNFCTGGDLDEAHEMRGDDARLDEFLGDVNATLARLEESPLPVVAACQGLALAGGLEVMLACDVVFAASDARFGDQHVQYGLVPAWGGTQRLPERVGLARATDLLFSGRSIDAQTALQWGLVNYVSPLQTLHADALDYCRTLASRSRPGLAAMKRLARVSFNAHLPVGLRQEREAVVRIMAGPDPAEGLAASRTRRKPEFRG